VPGWLMFAVFWTTAFGALIWILTSTVRDMRERGSPKWARWVCVALFLVPPEPVLGLVFFMLDQKRHPPGPDGGSGWMGAIRRWGDRRRRRGGVR
jgi:hypothetical protein